MSIRRHADVTVWVRDHDNKSCVYRCKITTLMGELRIQCHTNKKNTTVTRERLYQVTVPDGHVLEVEVWEEDRQRQDNQLMKYCLSVRNCENGTMLITDKQGGSNLVEVVVKWGSPKTAKIETSQPSRPLEVEVLPNGYPCLVYTIGDAVSFTEFIMALRCILAAHPLREDILDDHKLLNVSSTRQHPVLERTGVSPEKSKWVYVKLQTETRCTKLLLRTDNVYVRGFENQNGVLYEMVDHIGKSKSIFQEGLFNPKFLEWGTEYRSVLNVTGNNTDAQILGILGGIVMGRNYAVDAVERLACFGMEGEKQDEQAARKALACLFLMVSESARMNPLQESFARGWLTDTGGFEEQLMNGYVWGRYWGKNSRVLQLWKENKYTFSSDLRQRLEREKLPATEKDFVTALQDIHLVLKNKESRRNEGMGVGNTPNPDDERKEDNGAWHGTSPPGPSKPDEASSSGSPGSNNDNTTNPPKGDGGPPGGPGKTGTTSVESHNASGNGIPLVELFAIHANLRAMGEEIVVFDGMRGQIIYNKGQQQEGQQGDQGAQGMVELVLTGPYRCISAEYGGFAIQIDMPSSNNKYEWEWDCDEEEAFEPTCQVQDIKDAQGSMVAKVTYAVMPNALEATVDKVMLQLKRGYTFDSDKDGTITARNDMFEERSVLFHGNTQEAADKRSSDTPDIPYRLRLHRNVVAVPCGKGLRIEVKVPIKTSEGIEHLMEDNLRFENGEPNHSHQNAYGNIEVNILWYPKVAREQEVVNESSRLGEETRPGPRHLEDDAPKTSQQEEALQQRISQARTCAEEYRNWEEL